VSAARTAISTYCGQARRGAPPPAGAADLRRLLGLEVPVDVIVVTPEDIAAFRDKVGTIIGPALREGRDVYVA